MAVDANSWDEAERRRRQFRDWLVKAWEWALDHHPRISERIAELVGHTDEPDYPLWAMAARLEIVGEGPLADALRHACGIPLQGETANGWEKQINYSPVIKLDKETWERIYAQLGWANRDTDTKLQGRNFFLWSNSGNVIRFVVREEVTTECHHIEVVETT